MPISAKLREYLDDNNIKYVIITHSRAYTAQEVAQSVHVPGKELAKAVIVKLDGKSIMAVLPASYKIDLKRLAKAAHAEKAEVASENEFKELFPECEIGAMPIFGNIYDLDVYVAESLKEDEELVFNAGTHTQVIKLSYKDFEKLVKPKVLKFSEPI